MMTGKSEKSLLPKQWRNNVVEPPPKEITAEPKSKKPARLVSLDAYRGFIMTMLAANGFGILAFSRLDADLPVWQVHDHSWWTNLAIQFEHPEWVSLFGAAGVSFWDLIQPAFMFMVGVSMPFSYGRRAMMGQKDGARLLHALLRSVILVLMGVFLNSMRADRTEWAFPNVLCQIGLGYFFAWLLLNRSIAVQVTSLILLLSFNWLMFYLNQPPADYDYAAVHASKEHGEIFEGRFAPWSKNANTAFLFDEWLLPKLRSLPGPLPQQQPDLPVHQPNDSAGSDVNSDGANAGGTSGSAEIMVAADGATGAVGITAAGNSVNEVKRPPMIWTWFFSTTSEYKSNSGGYTTLNFVPSIGTTLLGMMCGQLLLAATVSPWKKFGMLVLAAVLCLFIGVGLHHYVCPVVKRIWTPSWVFFSGGYVIGMLALFYLLFDLLPLKLLAMPLVVVGMNSILIYMMGQLVRSWTAKHLLRTHFSGFIETVLGQRALDPEWYGPITESTGVFLLFWLFLFWLYRQRIFLRI